jgi:large subunit ribosomal protein L18
MNRLAQKSKNVALRAHRTRTRVRGTTERPRLSVTITNIHVSAQIINDETHQTLASASTVGQKSVKGTMTEKAAWVGAEIAAAAKGKKVKAVVFDRGAKQYHGRVKALADAARAAGLEF